ncbi:GlcNAc-PI de-N-acetylase [Chitinophaga sp. YR627]|uniref:PIG-L family deacetylase n=1 Tax=Chitinophaga sp. YR627 TaxID=1881041 RepID=UPI0008E4E2A3|nr:PIG-L family deacetylase [Chitinophaga sp. YR627]SFO66771.1 GlcNAc-PI de-N-acetylase [Chitinophaga sp. YR627]
MVKGFCLTLISGLVAVTAWAQRSPLINAADIKLQLKKLDTLGSVLYIAAHPDDENTRLLGYLAKDKLYRTGYLSLTRGDGGQNLVGDEQGELLGLIRTQELLAARRIDGAEQFFTRALDFGFSKNPAETFTIWDKEKILGDVVWMIRKFQPDVIVCRFPPDSRAGHGHHTASAMLAEEAFEAAADPKRYPEQLKQLKPWKAHRIMWNSFNWGGAIDNSAGLLYELNVGTFNYLLGRGYGEIAAESRSQHKSQGFGVAATRGSSYEYFSPVKGDKPVYSLLDGVNTTWTRITGGKPIGEMVDKAQANFNIEDPAASVPALLEIRKAIKALPEGYWRTQKLKETEDLLLACAGLWMEAYSNAQVVVPGQPMQGSVQLLCNSNANVTVDQITFGGKDTTFNKLPLEFNRLRTINESMTLPAGLAESQPYWLQDPHPIGIYTIKDPMMVGYPENKPALEAVIRLRINGEQLTVTRPVQYKFTDPVKGELYEPLVVAPPVIATLNNSVFIFTQTQSQPVQVKLRAMGLPNKGTVRLQLPAGFTSQEAEQSYELSSKGDETAVTFHIAPQKVAGINRTDTLRVEIRSEGKVYTQSIRTIAYDHIPDINIFPEATARLVTVDLQRNGRKLGYISGAGDMVAASLRQVGYEVTILDEKEIMNGDLQQYDAIIAGVRVYNINPRIKYWQPRLMEYVKNGGTYLVQYNVSSPLVTTDIGPYPFTLTRDRVTDENAAVSILQPQNEIMHYPNKITDHDFDGWIQERGLYFTQMADASYQKLFAMHDKGEEDLQGSTLVANYGKGRYVYTSLAFFRELPAGVPGAYRLFVNLISKKK